jgi:hypothetical protein
LPDQLTVAQQYERKLIYDLLGHEVMPDVPTDTPVQCFGHDVINPKRAGAATLPARRKRRQERAAPGGASMRRLRRGYGGESATRYRRGIDAVSDAT